VIVYMCIYHIISQFQQHSLQKTMWLLHKFPFNYGYMLLQKIYIIAIQKISCFIKMSDQGMTSFFVQARCYFILAMPPQQL